MHPLAIVYSLLSLQRWLWWMALGEKLGLQSTLNTKNKPCPEYLPLHGSSLSSATLLTIAVSIRLPPKKARTSNQVQLEHIILLENVHVRFSTCMATNKLFNSPVASIRVSFEIINCCKYMYSCTQWWCCECNNSEVPVAPSVATAGPCSVQLPSLLLSVKYTGKMKKKHYYRQQKFPCSKYPVCLHLTKIIFWIIISSKI